MVWTPFTEASANYIFLEAKIHQSISNLGMLEAETETNEEEATEETYHDDKRSRVAVKKNHSFFPNFGTMVFCYQNCSDLL